MKTNLKDNVFQIVIFIITILLLLIFSVGCGDSSKNGIKNESSADLMEVWSVKFDNGKGSGTFTVIKKSDNSIIVNGEWKYGTTLAYINNASATISGSSISFTGSGIAQDKSRTSNFTTTVYGNFDNGKMNGTYSTVFEQPGWSQKGSPNWTATRISGEGITH